jgi:cytochrome c
LPRARFSWVGQSCEVPRRRRLRTQTRRCSADNCITDGLASVSSPDAASAGFNPSADLETIMKHALTAFVVAAATAFSGAALAANGASKDDAMAMVKKGVAFLKANGTEKGYAAITAKDKQFVDRDLYLVVYGLDGKCLAHGANEKQVGKDLIELTDIDGKYFVKERVSLVKSKPAGVWQDYKFTNPTNKKIEPKTMYCEKFGETAVCGGIYQ